MCAQPKCLDSDSAPNEDVTARCAVDLDMSILEPSGMKNYILRPNNRLPTFSASFVIPAVSGEGIIECETKENAVRSQTGDFCRFPEGNGPGDVNTGLRNFGFNGVKLVCQNDDAEWEWTIKDNENADVGVATGTECKLLCLDQPFDEEQVEIPEPNSVLSYRCGANGLMTAVDNGLHTNQKNYIFDRQGGSNAYWSQCFQHTRNIECSAEAAVPEGLAVAFATDGVSVQAGDSNDDLQEVLFFN